MKLVYCPSCFDVLRFSNPRRHRTCDCGKSWGHYEKGGVDAVIGGLGIPLGFANGTLHRAIEARPNDGDGVDFRAFVIPMNCKTIKPG